MTNREEIITMLSEKNSDTDAIAVSFLDCSYCRDEDCKNPYEYGTIDYDMFCDACKMEWLDKEASDTDETEDIGLNS